MVRRGVAELGAVRRWGVKRHVARPVELRRCAVSLCCADVRVVRAVGVMRGAVCLCVADLRAVKQFVVGGRAVRNCIADIRAVGVLDR